MAQIESMISRWPDGYEYPHLHGPRPTLTASQRCGLIKVESMTTKETKRMTTENIVGRALVGILFACSGVTGTATMGMMYESTAVGEVAVAMVIGGAMTSALFLFALFLSGVDL